MSANSADLKGSAYKKRNLNLHKQAIFINIVIILLFNLVRIFT